MFPYVIPVFLFSIPNALLEAIIPHHWGIPLQVAVLQSVQTVELIVLLSTTMGLKKKE